MLYPYFLNNGDKIGITAISKGTGNDLKEVKTALNHFKSLGYKLVITPNVYGNLIVSSDRETRIREFQELLKEDIKLLFNIRGGDFSLEVIDKLDYQKIVDKRILVEGFSDITSLVYILTTKYDLMTLYGLNAKSFDSDSLQEYQLNNIEFLKGNFIRQESFGDRKTISLNGDFKSSGILIGGCLDVIRYLIGTEMDNTINFLEKYKEKKIIWYFDIFSMNSVDTYLTILQMKRIGWFKYTDTIMFGSVFFPKVECDLEYSDAYKKLFQNKNIIVDANIGHIEPVFTMVNGSLAKVEYKDNRLILEQELLDENNG